MVKAQEVWLEVSQGPRADGQTNQKIHALVLVIPMYGPMGMPIWPSPKAIFKFKFSDNAELGPRLRFDCYWDAYAANYKGNLHFPSEDGSVVQQLLSMAKEADWTGSFGEYLLWHRYIVKYAHKGPSPTFALLST
jgi:hypothetical protein